jgi:hypothetical protein
MEEKRRLEELNGEFTTLTRRALTSRGCSDLALDYKNPDYNPDLPFLWRATEWAKPLGVIAMALPGRIILKQSVKGKAARDAILQGLAVTGILNGSDLEKTPVWPKMDLPFLLLFARNAVPKPDHQFHFVTPIRENRLSSRGLFRLDYKASETVRARTVVDRPWLLKALAVGTVLDVQLVNKLSLGALRAYWNDNDLLSGIGYNLAQGTASTKDMLELSDFQPPAKGFAIPFQDLRSWPERHGQEMIKRAPDARLYQPPLVIVPETPGESRDDPKAFISWHKPVAFSRSNYGYSGAGSSAGQEIIATLYLAVHSLLFQYFCLMRSSRQGASFRTILKEDVDEFPFPDPRKMKASEKSRAVALAQRLEMEPLKPWDEIDEFVFRLYGLDEHDARVVRDTTDLCGPYQSVRQRAEEPVPLEDLQIFCRYLEDMLQPLFEVTGQRLVVQMVEYHTSEWLPSWKFVSVALAGDGLEGIQRLLERLLADATKTGASRIIVRIPEGGLLMGMINARRFWTRSRARLCSLHIEQHHIEAFPMIAR